VDFNFDHERPAWRFQSIDNDGAYGWANAGHDLIANEIFPKLKDFESMTWQAIERAGSHFINISDITRNAQKRLEEIKQDDIDQVFSLRLNGTNRIIGIREAHILKILWWDPNHDVCPSHLRNT